MYQSWRQLYNDNTITNTVRKMSNKLSQIITQINSDKLVYEINDKQELIKFIRPAIGFRTDKSSDNDLEIGKSKFGGQPDLPKSFVWPTYNNEPLTFCGQFNCSEFTHFDIEKQLPPKGIFSVFTFIDQNHPGFLINKNSFHFSYFDNIEDLQRTDFPVNYFKEGIFETASIEYFEHYNLPWANGFKFEEIKQNLINIESFYLLESDINEIIRNVTGQGYLTNQILGENYVDMDLSFVETKLDIRTQEDFQKNVNSMLEMRKNFVPIIQFSYNDPNTNMDRFGDGTAGFGLEVDDLTNLEFLKVSMGFQPY